ncbi:MAG TPA: hypothetical protein VM843_09255 [Flavisolibacter sp.]|nr:hypothetical protein [Flavisolibacter sp.]
MKKIVVAFVSLIIAHSLCAQRVFFVYLQSEKQVPFYVKMGDKVHSSTFSGYLILSSLKDSSYAITLGFPGHTSGESKFNFSISNNDKGYLIKDLDGAVALFDLQNLTLLKSLSAASKGPTQQTALRTDPFTKLLSQTSDDASLLTASVIVPETQKEAVVPEEKKDVVKTEDKAVPPVAETSKGEKPEEPRPLVDTTTLANEKKFEVKPEVAAPAVVEEKVAADTATAQPAQPTPSEEVFVRSVVTRRSESSTTEGFGLVFLDNQGGVIDTIRLLIPSSKIVLREEASVPKPEAYAASIEDQGASVMEAKPAPTSKTTTNCLAVASDKDFLRLRKNMAAEANEEKMIGLARRQFRTKCYTTEQVRNLSTLFLTSASKYQFFDVAFPAVSDRSAFALLGEELKEEYYVKRFKALIGE